MNSAQMKVWILLHLLQRRLNYYETDSEHEVIEEEEEEEKEDSWN